MEDENRGRDMNSKSDYDDLNTLTSPTTEGHGSFFFFFLTLEETLVNSLLFKAVQLNLRCLACLIPPSTHRGKESGAIPHPCQRTRSQESSLDPPWTGHLLPFYECSIFSVTVLPPPLMTKLCELDTTSAGDISSGSSISGRKSPSTGP